MADMNHRISYQFALQQFGAAGRFCMDMNGLCALVGSAKFPTQQSSFVSDMERHRPSLNWPRDF
jgi:hypothetical protein